MTAMHHLSGQGVPYALHFRHAAVTTGTVASLPCRPGH